LFESAPNEDNATCVVVVGNSVASCTDINERWAPSSNRMLAFLLAWPLTTGATAVFKRHIGVACRLPWEAGVRNDPSDTGIVTD